EASADPLLERGRIIALLEQIGIVIAFEHERIAAAKARLDIAGRRAEIGDDADTKYAVGHDELHGLAGIVRDRKRTNLEIADRKPVVAVEPVDSLHVGKALADDRERAKRQPDGNLVSRSERRNATDVIVVLVRHENCGERLG